MQRVRWRLTPILFAVTLALLFAPIAGASCIKRHQVTIAKGTSPSGWSWTVDGSIGNNGSDCGEWLFGMDFDLQGATRWGWGTGIPAGGHLDRRFEMSASDDLLEDGSSRVFSGTVSGEVAKVVLTLSNNKHLAIRPKSPPPQLRRKVVWLRGVRYFVEYYPPEGFVTEVAEFSASGQLLHRDKSFDGL